MPPSPTQDTAPRPPSGKPQAPNFSVFDNWLQDPAYLAGILAGVATGAAVARDERVRRHYDAGEIRERLHARHDEAEVTQ